jgi:hypothetical protein
MPARRAVSVDSPTSEVASTMRTGPLSRPMRRSRTVQVGVQFAQIELTITGWSRNSNAVSRRVR